MFLILAQRVTEQQYVDMTSSPFSLSFKADIMLMSLLKDDTKAIKLAMNDGKRCAEKCHGSTTKNAIVYFPPGTYRVSTSIPMPFGTQVIGDVCFLSHVPVGAVLTSTDIL